MKVKELMIGDWVTFCGQHHKVISIDIEFGSNITDNDNLIKPEEISPIPLTPEILKKNGFVKSYDGSWYIPKHITPTSCHLYVEVFSDDLGFDPYEETLKVICHNVHFLQHALRFSGMIDIADNFKV